MDSKTGIWSPKPILGPTGYRTSIVPIIVLGGPPFWIFVPHFPLMFASPPPRAPQPFSSPSPSPHPSHHRSPPLHPTPHHLLTPHSTHQHTHQSHPSRGPSATPSMSTQIAWVIRLVPGQLNVNEPLTQSANFHQRHERRALGPQLNLKEPLTRDPKLPSASWALGPWTWPWPALAGNVLERGAAYYYKEARPSF